MRNPFIPYAIIAILGIVIMVIVAYFGVFQREAIQNPDAVQEGESISSAEDIYKDSCASCHGGDLTGASGPELEQVGDRLSEDEIKDIIVDGIPPGMPGGLVNNEEAGVLAEWLAEQE